MENIAEHNKIIEKKFDHFYGKKKIDEKISKKASIEEVSELVNDLGGQMNDFVKEENVVRLLEDKIS